jgi:hypothetical protein
LLATQVKRIKTKRGREPLFNCLKVKKVRKVMHLKSYLGTFLLIYSCNAYVHDERFVSSENMTVLDIIRKMASVDDLIVPSVSEFERGDVFCGKCVGIFLMKVFRFRLSQRTCSQNFTISKTFLAVWRRRV